MGSTSVTRLRTKIKDLRSELLEEQNYSVAAIREHIQLEEEVLNLENARDEFNDLIGEFKKTAESWQTNRAKYAELPADYFSASDKKKLQALTREFRANVQRFGYRSSDISQLNIAEDGYRPICDGFDITVGASASDNIRVIWAYSIALLQVSRAFNGKHWGLIIFDEPEQQKMNEASSEELYETFGLIPAGQYQAIVTTSAPAEITKQRLSSIAHNLIEFGDKVIASVKKFL